MADVFISYSRRDFAFARRLTEALRGAGKSVFIDVGEIWGESFGPGPSVATSPGERPPADLAGVSSATEASGADAVPGQEVGSVRAQSEVSGILPSARWMEEIEQAIAAADAVVFLVSPDSVSSRVCIDQELQIAIRLNKRLVPVRPILALQNAEGDGPEETWIARTTPDADVPGQLAALNFVPFGSDDPAAAALPVDEATFEQSISRLVRILDTDIERYHEHTRLLEQAREWEASGQDRSRLLRGSQLGQARRWLEAGGLPEPTGTQRALIAASERGKSRRRKAWLTSAVVIAFVVGAVAAWALVSHSQAVRASHVALSGQLASGSGAAASTSVPIQDMLALEAYQRSPTVSARSALTGAAEQPLQKVLQADVGGINSVAVDPAGPYLAAGGDRGAAILDAAGRVIHRIDTNRVINSVAFSHNGQVLALGEDALSVATTGSRGGRVVLVHPPTGTVTGQIVERANVGAVAFSTVGTELAVGAGPEVSVLDLRTKVSTQTQVDALVATLSFSPDSSLLAVGGTADTSDSTNALLNVFALSGDAGLGTPVATYSEQQADFSGIAFSPDGSTLAVVGDDGFLRLFDPTNLEQTNQVNLGSGGNCVAFSPDGSLIATGNSQGAVQLWNRSGLSEEGAPMGTGSVVYGVAFSDDGATVDSGGFGGEVVQWSSTSRSPLTSSITDTSSIQSLSVNSTGSLMAAANINGVVTIWNLPGRSVKGSLGGSVALSAVAFDPADPSTLAIGDADGTTFLYDIDSKQSIPLKGQPDTILFEAFAPNGRWLAAATTGGEVTVWNVATKKVLRSYSQGRGAGVTAVAFSPDSSLLAMASLNRGIAIFNVDDPASPGRGVSVAEAINALAFSPDGSELAAGDLLGNVELFTTSDGRPDGTLFGDGNTIYTLAFSPDNGTLATGDNAGQLHFWDLASRQQLGTDAGTGSTILSLSFGPSGSDLATGSENGALVFWPSLLWSTDVQAFSDDLCPRLGQNLTQQQWQQFVGGQPYHATCPAYPAGR